MPGWPYTTSRWRKLRAAKLVRSPLCHACELSGRLTAASVVDHNVPVSQGGDPFPPLDGLTALCAPCHNSKTSSHDRAPSVTGRRFKGVGLDGQPLDLADGWHATGDRGASDHGNGRGAKPSAPSTTDILNEPNGSDWRL